jgi:SAM-dependent methyltransferase
VKTPILATCPEYICNSCGKPRVKIMEKVNNVSQADRTKCKLKKKAGEKRYEVNTAPSPDLIEKYKEVGLTDCGCGAKWNAGIVLDPFCGSGTSCVVAKRLGRRWIGIDLNPDYSRMARTRLDETSVSIPQSTPEPKVVMATYPAIEVDDGETF